MRAGITGFSLILLTTAIAASFILSENLILREHIMERSLIRLDWIIYLFNLLTSGTLLLARVTFMLSRLAEATAVLNQRVQRKSHMLDTRDREPETATDETKVPSSLLPICASGKTSETTTAAGQKSKNTSPIRLR